MKVGHEVNVFIVGNLLLALPTIWFKHWLVWGFVLSAAIALNASLVWFYRRERQYNLRLQQLLLKVQDDKT